MSASDSPTSWSHGQPADGRIDQFIWPCHVDGADAYGRPHDRCATTNAIGNGDGTLWPRSPIPLRQQQRSRQSVNGGNGCLDDGGGGSPHGYPGI